MKKNLRKNVCLIGLLLCILAAAFVALVSPQRNLIRVSDVTSVRSDGTAVSYHAAMELLRNINTIGGRRCYTGHNPVNEALDHVVDIRCEDGVRYELHYWYHSGFSFDPRHPGEDDYASILTLYNADGTAEKAWKLAYDFDETYRTWLKDQK